MFDWQTTNHKGDLWSHWEWQSWLTRARVQRTADSLSIIAAQRRASLCRNTFTKRMHEASLCVDTKIAFCRIEEREEDERSYSHKYNEFDYFITIFCMYFTYEIWLFQVKHWNFMKTKNTKIRTNNAWRWHWMAWMNESTILVPASCVYLYYKSAVARMIDKVFERSSVLALCTPHCQLAASHGKCVNCIDPLGPYMSQLLKSLSMPPPSPSTIVCARWSWIHPIVMRISYAHN